MFTVMLIIVMSSGWVYADDPATFETIYDPEKPTNWALMVFIGVIAGAAVFFTGGLASGFVVSGVSALGTAIGGLMGFSGAAATSAGLAFLGGGSIAAGGLGMAGGAALLTAALTFSSEVIMSKAADFVTEVPVDLSVASRGRVDLHYPVYKQGSKGLRRASEYLEDNISKEELLDGPHNREILKRALEMMRDAKFDGIKERLQVHSAMAIVSLILDDYKTAYTLAATTVEAAQKQGETAPVAQYILGVSSLYHQEESQEIDHFKYIAEAMKTEKKRSNSKSFEKIIPLLLSVYSDRVQLKMIIGDLNPNALHNIALLIDQLHLPAQSAFLCLYPLATRHLMMLKLYQTKIVSITQSENETIRSNVKAVRVVQNAFEYYRQTVRGLEKVSHRFNTLNLSSKNESKAELKITEIEQALIGYRQDVQRLSDMVDVFHKEERAQSGDLMSSAEESTQLFILAGVFIIGLGFIWRRRSGQSL